MLGGAAMTKLTRDQITISRYNRAGWCAILLAIAVVVAEILARL